MNLSRAEKNKALYEQLLADPESEIQTNDLEKIANRLNKIDSDNFSEMNTLKASTNPLHVSVNAKPAFFEEKEEKEEVATNFEREQGPKFNNEYLDDFINEVKQYNISKGNRTQEDTQTALFNKILKDNGISKSETITKPEEVKIENITQDESFEVDPIVEVYEDTSTVEEKKEETLDLQTEIKELLKETKQETKVIESQDSQKALEITQELLEKTSKIKAQMDNYDSKLVDVDDKMDKVNRTLNIVLVTLFLALIALLVVIVIYVISQKVHL